MGREGYVIYNKNLPIFALLQNFVLKPFLRFVFKISQKTMISSYQNKARAERSQTFFNDALCAK